MSMEIRWQLDCPILYLGQASARVLYCSRCAEYARFQEAELKVVNPKLGWIVFMVQEMNFPQVLSKILINCQNPLTTST
jgi:hypothetical protein